MDDMADMYNDSLEYYLNRVIGLDDAMMGMDSDEMEMMGSDDDDQPAPKGGKAKKNAQPDAGAEAKKDCK
jgi:hypothetical protein